MKICILGDTHFGMRGDSLEFHSHYSKFYTNVFFPYLNDNGINTIFQLGDLFDRRKFINFQSLYLCRNYFFDKLLEENIQFHTLLGNHDIAFKNTLRVNSTSLLLNDYNNIHIHDKFKTMDFGGIDIDIVPWICEENEIEKKKEKQYNKIVNFNFNGNKINDLKLDYIKIIYIYIKFSLFNNIYDQLY